MGGGMKAKHYTEGKFQRCARGRKWRIAIAVRLREPTDKHIQFGFTLFLPRCTAKAVRGAVGGTQQ